MKKGLLLTTFLGLITLVSAYGESSGLSIGRFYLNIDLLASVAIFMTIFVVLTYAMRKNNLLATDGARIFVSLVLAMFSVYGLYKLNFSYEEIFIHWGILNFLQDFLWIIIFGLIALIWIVFNFRTVLLTIGSGLILLGLIGLFSPETVYNWELSVIVGAIFIGIYFWAKNKQKEKPKTDEEKEQEKKKALKIIMGE